MLMRTFLVVMIAGMALTGCAGRATPTATPTMRPLPTVAATAVPTTVPAPTNTPHPTKTPTPTIQPTNQPTVQPTNQPTIQPTNTPTPLPTPTPKAVITPIGSITGERTGEEVTVEGTVVGTASFSKGFKFTLDDGTGQIVLLMWHNVYDDCWDAPEINQGAVVRASGKIAEYEGELQIQPDFGGDVKAIRGAVASAPSREIGSLSGNDVGQRVMIEGLVTPKGGTEKWVKFSISDGTGEVVVFVWRTVLDRIERNVGLGTEGSRVRVVGVVQIYRNNLQVVPTLPVDVTVLEVAGQ